MWDKLNQLKMLAGLAKDEHFKKLLAHPEIQSLMASPDVREAMEQKNYLKLMSHPGIQKLLQSREIQDALFKMNFPK